jgi:hypothetical protein
MGSVLCVPMPARRVLRRDIKNQGIESMFARSNSPRHNGRAAAGASSPPEYPRHEVNGVKCMGFFLAAIV